MTYILQRGPAFVVSTFVAVLVAATACGDLEPAAPPATPKPTDAPAVTSPTPTRTATATPEQPTATPTEPTVTAITTIPQTETPIPSPTPDPVAGFAVNNDLTETYRDDELGFSISYPRNWTRGDVDGGVDFGIRSSIGGELLVSVGPIPGGDSDTSLEAAVSLILTALTDTDGDFELTSRREISDPEGVRLDGRGNLDPESGPVSRSYSFLVFRMDNLMYVVTANTAEQIEEFLRPVVDAMLDSFTVFPRQAADYVVLDKVYRSEAVGIAISYPSSWTLGEYFPGEVTIDHPLGSSVSILGVPAFANQGITFDEMAESFLLGIKSEAVDWEGFAPEEIDHPPWSAGRGEGHLRVRRPNHVHSFHDVAGKEWRSRRNDKC